ncbi:MAG: MarR family winged helix-turn-helix transcriptional regulator [Amnibacterium sp.]
MSGSDPASITEEQLALGRALEQVVTLLRRSRRTSDVSATALSLLDRLDSDGAQRITDLAAHEGITQPAMTALVNRLEERGWAERAADPADGRAIRVSITEAGRERLQRHRADRTRRIAERLAALEPEDQGALLAALPALNHLTAAPDAAPSVRPGDPVHA